MDVLTARLVSSGPTPKRSCVQLLRLLLTMLSTGRGLLLFGGALSGSCSVVVRVSGVLRIRSFSQYSGSYTETQMWLSRLVLYIRGILGIYI